MSEKCAIENNAATGSNYLKTEVFGLEFFEKAENRRVCKVGYLSQVQYTRKRSLNFCDCLTNFHPF